MLMKSICVFCGSSFGSRTTYAEGARALGTALARQGIRLVYGGGRVGLMGVVADAAMAGGGEVIGVIPRPLATKELAHAALTTLHVVETMHDRKALMADLSDGFIAMPGGYGTLEEFFEVLTWAQLGLHPKPCGLLNIEGYFNPLLALIEHSVEEAFVRPEHRTLVLQETDPERMLAAMRTYVAPPIPKWIDREAT
jgi:uncharacterized protein (TIGR00730 family)